MAVKNETGANSRVGIKEFFQNADDVLALFDSTFEGIMIHESGLILDVNAAFARMVGYDRDDLIGMSGFDLVCPDSMAAVKNQVASGSEDTYDADIKCRDGRTFKAEITARDREYCGRTIRIAAIRDITERHTAKQNLAESEKRFRDLVEASSECICKIDMDGRFKYMSPAGLHAHGLREQSEIINKHCTELAEPEFADLLHKTLHQAQHGLTQKFEYQSETILGVMWFESVITPQRDANGDVIGFIRVSRDIEDRKRAEDKLQESWEKLRGTLAGTVEALSSTAGLRDPYTADHQKRVAKLAEAIAQELGLDREQCEGVRVSSTLHDLGKIYVPAEILSKPGVLNEFEFKIIEAHAQASHDIVKGIDFPWPVARAVLEHHERLDGSGYPKGLNGDEICIEAKILSVADVVEAMSSRRPYRAGLGLDKALAEISKNSGHLYDREVSSICSNLFISKKFDWRGDRL